MSGHSHWSKVKRAKATTDAKRGQSWSKLSRRVIVAARSGGGNPDENLSLRYAIDECRAASMPNDTIDRAIKKGTGELGGENYELAMYEGYGPGGVAFMVECLTNNRNRTAPDLRVIFDRHGGQLGVANSVAWMFQPKGTFVIADQVIAEDALMEVALDAGAEDVVHEGDSFEVVCSVNDFARLREALAKHKISTLSAKLGMIPSNTIPVSGDKARQVIKLMEGLEEHEDVQNVYTNFDIPDDVLAQIAKE